MRTMKILVINIVLLFLLSAVANDAHAGASTDQVKQTVDKVIDILKDKELKKPANEKKRRAEIRSVVSERFDFEEMAKRSLAIHWKQRTPEEKKEFVPLFTDLLEKNYIKKIEAYTDQKVLFTGERTEGNYAVVNSKVTKGNIETPIDYKLLNENGQWRAYDVVIEGVSLVNNYRNQFNRIIREKSYEEVVRRLKSKEEKLSEEK